MSEDYDKFDEIPPFKVNTDPSIALSNEDSPWFRRKVKQSKKRRNNTTDGNIGDV